MFCRYLIALHLSLGMVFSAPLYMKRKTEDSKKSVLLPSIYQPRLLQNTINYETLGDGFEGDMIFPEGFNPSKQSTAYGAAHYRARHWPNNIIPYDLSDNISISDQNTIIRATNRLMYDVGRTMTGDPSGRMCIYFRPKRSSDQNYLRFIYGRGCSATVGYLPGSQARVALSQRGCFFSGIIQHELMHVLGFFHEQSRPDRDEYVTVNYGNIESGREGNFNKYAWGTGVVNQSTAYDYDSLMHYGAYDFSHNRQPTIWPKKDGAKIGQRAKLSMTDIAEIRAYYSC